MARLILASRSPRRQEALAALGLQFDVAVSDVEQRLPPPADPVDPIPIAAAKAADVARRHPDSIVLAGDTMVVLGTSDLGKPESPEHAQEMLRALRGREHRVVSAAVVQHGSGVTAAVSCPVRMRDYGDDEIARYVATGEPMDCAGGYDVHRLGGALVAGVAGCFATVVGLPLVQAARMLAAAGVEIGPDPAAVCTALYGRRCLAEAGPTRSACLANLPGSGGGA